MKGTVLAWSLQERVVNILKESGQQKDDIASRDETLGDRSDPKTVELLLAYLESVTLFR